jgi:AraC-like DNA-binding protein
MESRQVKSRDRRRLERARDHYLQTCYRLRTAARASEFASNLGVTTAYLSRLVASVVGMSVREFLRRSQLAYAAQLLRSTPLPISDIAIATGFGTPSTFYRCFLAFYGTPPGEARQVSQRKRSGKTR